MSNETENKYAAKIAALLRKAESTTHEEEAEALREKAYALMAKWGVDDAMAAAAAEQAGGPREKIEKRTVRFTDQFAVAWSRLWNGTALGMGGLKVVQEQLRNSRGRLNGQIDLHVVGHESDLDRFLSLVTSLRLQAQREEARWWALHRYDFHETEDGGARMLTPSEGFRQRREFLFGFAAGVRKKLEAQRVQATRETTGSALVLVDRQALVLAEAPKLVGAFAPQTDWLSHGTAGAKRAGVQAGLQSDLGDKRLGGKRTLPAA